VLTVRAPSEELRDELTEGLVALGGAAVEEDVDLLTTYLPPPDDPDAFLAHAAETLGAIADGDPDLLWRWQEDEDWSVRWKEGLGPRSVGPRITVTQPWNHVSEDGNEIVIVIDPAMAFGTGEHATTRGALRLMQAELEGGERVLDVGSGSGILAIAAARLGAAHVLAVESDEDAMETARENLERNGVGERIELIHALVDSAYLAAVRADGFDLVVANVLSGILVPLLPPLAAVLRPGACLILGGILDTEAAGVVSAASAAGLAFVREDREGEWWTGLFRPELESAAPD
jgi:ribosomal protein L11 methyltransferase